MLLTSRRIFVFIVALILSGLVTCRDIPTNAPSSAKLLAIAAKTDTSDYRAAIERDHTGVRYALDTLLQRFLISRASQPPGTDSLSGARLWWLAREYSELTGITDMRGQLELYSTWSTEEAAAKLGFDSSYSSLVSQTVLRRSELDEKALNRALDDLKLLRSSYEEIDDIRMVSSIDFSRAQLLITLNDINGALTLLDSCTSRCNRIEYFDLAGDCALLQAQTQMRMSADFYRATASVLSAIASFRQTDRVDRLIRAEVFQAHIWYRLGLPDRAVESYHDVLHEMDRVSLPRLEGFCNYALAEAFYDLGMLDSAEFYCRSSREIRKTLADHGAAGQSDLAYSVSTLALISQSQGDTDAALSMYREALDLFDASGDSSEVFVTMNRLASFYIEHKDLAKARALFQRVLQGTTVFEDNIFSLHGLALCSYLSGDLETSLEMVQNCIRRERRSRQAFLVPDIKYGMLSEKMGYYYLAAQVFIDKFRRDSSQTWLDSALAYVESSRAASLLEQLRSTETRGPSSHATDSLLQKIAGLENRLIVEAVSDSIATSTLKSLKDSLTALQWRDAQTARDTVVGDPRYPVQEFPGTILSDLPQDQLIIDYMISDIGCFALLIKGGDVTLRELSVTNRELDDSVEALVSQINVFPWGEDPGNWRTTARWLYDKLLGGVADNSADSSLVIILSGNLHRLPFGVLIDENGQLLVRRRVASYAPSLTIYSDLAQGRSRAAGNQGVAFADPLYRTEAVPQLPETSREVAAIARIPGLVLRQVYEGDAANRQNFRACPFDSLDFIHLAVHGLPNEAEPMLSSLLLAPDAEQEGVGTIDAAEIARLRIPCGLVFLSVCHSAAGRIYRGEGTMSLVRPFMIAGTQTAIASLWDVDDRAAVDLTTLFYQQYAQGHDPAAALAYAQRGMLDHERKLYHHPYFWAAFECFGRS